MRFSLHRQTFDFDNNPVALFVPDAAAVRQAFLRGEIVSPYWSQVWPSAKALGVFLVQHASFIRHKTVLELGAGLGLPSLVAARFATQVHCTDYLPEAIEAVTQSVAAAGLKNVTASVLDWRHLPAETTTDVVLLSDVNYEPEVFEALQELIASFLQKSTTVILSTRQRLMARRFVTPLLAHCLLQQEMETSHEGKTVLITVMVLQKTTTG